MESSNLSNEISPFNIPHLISTNSFELTSVTSLSDDSGIPTNSSISSGSSRLTTGGRFEFELIESDAEVSQLDSLENCSDGGMSAENFNTLKKVPIATIEPPPEFQDSPQTTLLRAPHIQNFASHVAKKILSNAITCYTFLPKFEIRKRILDEEAQRDEDGNYFVTKPEHIYNENIYDTQAAGSAFVLTKSRTMEKQATDEEEPTYDVPANYEEDDDGNVAAGGAVWQSEKTSSTQRSKLFESGTASEIYDYDLYYNLKPTSSFDRRRTPPSVLYSPHCQSTHNSNSSSSHHHHHNFHQLSYHQCYHYHQNSSNMSTANRPNSRNSLNSRLSSSHNSLNVTTSNKVDDSIFITQAMSHDALMGHEISDFYNVPFDSDMCDYSLPVDMLKTNKIYDQPANFKTSAFSLIKNHRIVASSFSSFDKIDKIKINNGKAHHHHCMKLKNSRNVKKRKRSNNNNNNNNSTNNNNDIYDTEKNAGLHCKNAGISHNNNNNLNINNNNNNNNLDKSTTKSTKSSKNYSSTTLVTHATGLSAANSKSFAQTSASSSAISNGGTVGISDKRYSIPNDNLITDHGNSNLYSTSSDSNETLHCKNYAANSRNKTTTTTTSTTTTSTNNKNDNKNNYSVGTTATTKGGKSSKSQPNSSGHTSKDKKSASTKDEVNLNNNNIKYGSTAATQKTNKKSQFSMNLNLKQKFCSMFRFKKSHHQHQQQSDTHQSVEGSVYGVNGTVTKQTEDGKTTKFSSRALPPLPGKGSVAPMPAPTPIFATITSEEPSVETKKESKVSNSDFPASIQKVKEYGWYWGPISSESAEKILSNEPDGSFIVRDSSDDHYIFALTFKLNGYIRHVRIEQDKGTFSFGSYAKFQSRTIMEFIEKAVEHSRDGRYLFFMQRRPEYGPLRVQLTNPVSRFKHVQSLQHMCRFVILKAVVRFDLAETLPLPRRMLDYLCNKNCLSEQIESDSSSQSQIYGDNPSST